MPFCDHRGSIINILFAVQHIILQKLQIHQIICFILTIHSLLMIIEYRTCVDADTIHHFCHQLIGRDGSVFFFQSDIIPDHIIGVKQASALHIRLCQAHSGQMVAVEYNNGRFPSFSHHVCQIFRENIHFINLIGIIGPLVVFLRSFHAPCIQMGIIQYFFFRITAVALYRDGKDKVLLFCGIQTVSDMRDQHFILRPAIGGRIKIHELLAHKSVETDIIKYFSTAVEVAAVIMDRMGTITKSTEGRCCTFCCFFLQIGFIRIFPGAKVSQVHPCNDLKLRIGCTGTNRRHLTIAGGIFLCHFSQIRQRIRSRFQRFEFGCIKERFQLYKNHIGKYSCIRYIFCNGAVFADLRNHLPGIPIGLGYPRIKDTCRKTVRQAIILICKGNIGKIRGDDTVCDHIIRQHTITAKGGRNDHR